MRCLRSAMFVLLTSAALVACAEPTEMSGADFCKEVGYAIANRTLACDGDADLANERYERFERDLVCVENNALSEGRQGGICPVSSLACEGVLASGEDLAWWIAASDCNAWFTRLDGSQIPPLVADGGVTPSCDPPKTLCQSTCVDLDSDDANCGSCGLRGRSGSRCVARICE